MKFSHFVEHIAVNKPTDEYFCKRLVIYLVIQHFTGFASTIHSGLEIILLNALFSLIESLIHAQFANAVCFLINVLIFL